MIGAGVDVVILALNDACLETLFLAGPCQDFVNRDVRQMLQLLARHIPVEQVCHLLKVCSDSQLQQLNRLIRNGTSVPDLVTLMVPRPPRTRILLPDDGPRQSILQYHFNEYDDLVGEITQNNGEQVFTFLARYKLLKNQRHCPEPNCAALMTFTKDSSHTSDGYKVKLQNTVSLQNSMGGGA